ncbi:MAG: cell envelope integrity protein TolA [Prolixibacteraceae bacterium]|nr:cell envelope integrity protein TolA [Prolixibacteraceae bacterium]
MSYFKKHKEGIILTLLFHLALFFILLKFGFFTPLPLPDEKGVLVDFGTSNTGMGKVEPAPQRQQAQQQEPVEQVIPPEPTPPQASEPDVQEPEAKEEVMTQDFEDAAAIEAAKKKAEEKKKEEELKRREEAERKKIEEQARQKRLAEEKRVRDSLQRIEQARQAEIRRIAEQRRRDSIRKAEEDAKIAEINSRAKNVFGGTGQNTNSTSTGQGATYQPGNQGSVDGTPGVNRYGPGGGEGISFNLSGRSAVSLPEPLYPGNDEGIVVVEVTVDKYGKVTKATPGVKGSTSLNGELLKAAQNAALRTRFNENADAPAFQTGTITYRFVLTN